MQTILLSFDVVFGRESDFSDPPPLPPEPGANIAVRTAWNLANRMILQGAAAAPVPVPAPTQDEIRKYEKMKREHEFQTAIFNRNRITRPASIAVFLLAGTVKSVCSSAISTPFFHSSFSPFIFAKTCVPHLQLLLLRSHTICWTSEIRFPSESDESKMFFHKNSITKNGDDHLTGYLPVSVQICNHLKTTRYAAHSIRRITVTNEFNRGVLDFIVGFLKNLEELFILDLKKDRLTVRMSELANTMTENSNHQQVPRLKKLVMSYSSGTWMNFGPLARQIAPTLQSLELRRTNKESDAEFRELRFLKNLRHLKLIEVTGLTGDSFEEVFSQVKYLYTLTINSTTVYKVGGLRHLEFLEELHLHLRSTSQHDERSLQGTPQWPGFPLLKKFTFEFIRVAEVDDSSDTTNHQNPFPRFGTGALASLEELCVSMYRRYYNGSMILVKLLEGARTPKEDLVAVATSQSVVVVENNKLQRVALAEGRVTPEIMNELSKCFALQQVNFGHVHFINWNDEGTGANNYAMWHAPAESLKAVHFSSSCKYDNYTFQQIPRKFNFFAPCTTAKFRINQRKLSYREMIEVTHLKNNNHDNDDVVSFPLIDMEFVPGDFIEKKLQHQKHMPDFSHETTAHQQTAAASTQLAMNPSRRAPNSTTVRLHSQLPDMFAAQRALPTRTQLTSKLVFDYGLMIENDVILTVVESLYPNVDEITKTLTQMQQDAKLQLEGESQPVPTNVEGMSQLEKQRSRDLQQALLLSYLEENSNKVHPTSTVAVAVLSRSELIKQMQDEFGLLPMEDIIAAVERDFPNIVQVKTVLHQRQLDVAAYFAK